jgi:class 3 adenylate cyclase
MPRPPRGEGSIVLGVRVAQSLRDELERVARDAGVPMATILRASGLALARTSQTWTREQLLAFVKKYGAASSERT